MSKNFFKSKHGEEATIISFDCSPSSPLNFDFSSVEKIVAEGGKIALSLSFGLDKESTNFHEETLFAARRYALEYLSQKILVPYEANILSLIFYEGVFDFTPSLYKFANLRLLYKEYLEDLEKKDEPHYRRLFSLELLMTYLHRLSACLSLEFFSCVLLEMPRWLLKSEIAEFLSKDYFPYIYPGCKNPPCFFEGVGWGNNFGLYGYVGAKELFAVPEEPTIGVALPARGFVDYSLVEELIEELRGASFRIFPEHLVVESWGGLEKIYIFSESLGSETRRRLQGFIAAEGVVEEFRGRGIRTPDLLVPNQTR